jgi:hypothetical protein
MAKLSLSDVHGPPLSKAYRREGESTVVKRVRLKRKARSQSKVVSSAPSVPSVPSATPDPSEQPSPPSMMGEPRKRALKKQSDYVGWCERRALVQSRWLNRDYPYARSATCSAPMLKHKMAASLGLSATAARDWSRLRWPIVGRSRTGRHSTASCARQRSALHLRQAAQSMPA